MIQNYIKLLVCSLQIGCGYDFDTTSIKKWFTQISIEQMWKTMKKMFSCLDKIQHLIRHKDNH